MKASLPLEIDVEEVAALLGQPERALRLVDCREADEWQCCRIDGAEFVPLTRFGELAAQRFTDPSERIVVYCHHGMRSQRAAHFLREHGFAKAQSMRGGIDLWSDRVDPTVPKY